jgi:predicted nucleic acid-binding protein
MIAYLRASVGTFGQLNPVFIESPATLMADARSQGHALSMADGCIRAIAKAHNAIVASRDIGPFHATNTQVINPWIA